MPDFDYTPLTELTELTATSANSRFTGAANTINNLPAEAVAPKCFQTAHLPSAVVERGTGVSHRWVLGSGTPTIHTYLLSDLGSGAWIDVNNNGSSGGGTSATLTFANPVALANGGPIAGILVMADVNMQFLGTTGGGSGGADYLANFRIAWRQGGGAWTGINRSERHVNDRALGHNQFVSVSLRTLILASDNATIDSVRLETGITDQQSAGAAIKTVLRQCQITALVIRSEKN